MFSETNEINLEKTNKWCTIVLANEISVGASVGDNGYGVIIPMQDRDGKYMIMASNISSSLPCEVKIKAGNGINASTFEPTITLGPSSSAVIQIESGLFKHVKDEGAMKAESESTSIVGKVFLTSSTSSVKVKVFHTVM